MIDHWHQIDKDEIVYYHNQFNGDPYALSSAQGELIWKTENYLWGSYRHPAKNQVTLLYGQPLRFQGQYFAKETELHYNTFRYYDPETGCFTQQDPIGLAGGINLYQYAPNPLAWIDPLGLTGLDCYKEAKLKNPPKNDPFTNSQLEALDGALKDISSAKGSPRIDTKTGEQTILEGHLAQQTKWKGALEWNVIEGNNELRILRKALPNGKTQVGFSNDHYVRIFDVILTN